MAFQFEREFSKSPNPIQKLPEILINQIAAGEVVERPASIVKELVENALDAGATRIDVSLKAGGIDEIKITDNGWGIDPNEILLAFERHATSKIKSLEDMEEIATFGFRGEALSSISSVSDIQLISRRSHLDYAISVQLNTGKLVKSPEKTGGAIGTQITVRSLFSKVPARQKFLRTPATELSHSLRILKEIALGNPQCFFSLSHETRTLAQFTQTSPIERFLEVLRPEIHPEFYTDETEDMRYEMLLLPLSEQPRKNELYLFINQRPVKNRVLLQAVKQAYQDTFGMGAEPSGAVYLTIRTDWVDPNVHPQKSEVRFLRQEVLFQWILNSLRKKLSTLAKISHPPDSLSRTQLERNEFDTRCSGIKYKTSLSGGFLLFEDAEGLLIAHDTRFRELQLRSYYSEQNIKTQSLKSPLLFSLTPMEREKYDTYLPLLRDTGFETDLLEDKDLIVKGYPDFLQENQITAFITELLRQPASSDTFFVVLSQYFLKEVPLFYNKISAFTKTPDGKRLFFRVLFDDLKGLKHL